jgi:archaellum component FlaC
VTLSSIKDLMETVAQQVQSEHDEDDTQADILQNAISQCNRNCLADQNNATSGVAYYENAAQNAGTAHQQCRENENVEEGNSTQHCQTYTDGGNAARDSKNHCDCSFSAESAPDSILECIETQATWADGHKKSLEVLKTKCDDATDVYEKQAQDCDDDQKNYESAFCQLAMKKDSVCGEFDTCRKQQIEEFNQICDEIEIVAETRKAVWQSLEKIKCYVDVMLTAAQRNITQTEVNGCIDKVVDTNHLNFDRPEIPPAVACPLEASRPGSEFWASRYSDSFRGLETVTACLGDIVIAPELQEHYDLVASHHKGDSI